jgi:hypothetical protein
LHLKIRRPLLLPVKDLRTKTCGVGVHCFALYPTDWWPVIEEAIRSVGGERDRQGDLFR